MSSEEVPDIFSDHIMNATAQVKNNKKRHDNKSIREFIQKNISTNANFTFIEDFIEKHIKNKKIINKPIIQGLTS